MTFPTVLLGILMAAILGCAFHFWRGGGFKWLVLYNALAIAGFWLGQLIGSLFQIGLLKLGPLYLGMCILGSLIFLFGGYWLSMASVEKTTGK